MQPIDIGQQLVGLTEIAQRAGVQKPVVAMWRTRHSAFPRPIAELRTGAIWWWPQVEAWLRATGRPYDASLSIQQVNPHTRPFSPQRRHNADDS